MDYDVGALRAEQFPVITRQAYLDNATFGPPPRAWVEAGEACLRALSDRTLRWGDEVERVRALAGRLLGADPRDVAFLKSSAESMGLVALGLDWREGDEVVVYEREFPAGVLPWLNLAHLGVRVRFVRDHGRHRFDAEDVEELVGERTRAVCLGLVNFGNGLRTPVERVAEVCRRHGAWLLVDATQAAGVLRIDAARMGCHLLVAHGYKFLLSGYGTACCYVHPDLRAALRVPEPGWKTLGSMDDTAEVDYARIDPVEAAARFEPSVPDVTSIIGMGASLQLLLDLGVEEIERRTLALVASAAERVAERGYEVVSSARDAERSSILSIAREGTDPASLESVLRRAGVACAMRVGRLRLSLHGYNDDTDVDRLIAALPA